MLKSLKTLTRTLAFTVALLVGIAGFASQANAAAGDAIALTTAGSQVVLDAPFKTAFVAGYGMSHRFNVTLDSAAAETDFMVLYAFLYQNGTYVTAVRSNAATSGAAARTQTVTLPANNSPFAYNQVAFAYVNVGADGGITANATPDTLNGTAMTTRIMRIRPDQMTARINNGAGVGLSAVAVAAYTATSVDTNTDNIGQASLAAMGSALNSNLLSMSTYAGPVLISAGTSALAQGTDVKLTFDTALAAIADNNAVAVTNLQVDINENTGRSTAAITQGAVSAGAYIARFDDNSTAFDNTLATVDINPIALGSCLTNFVRDEAGNCAANSQTFTISAFAAPIFSTSGTAKGTLTAGTAVDSDAELLELNSTTGTGSNAEVFTFTVRMNENFNGVGINNVDDYTFAPAALETLANTTNTFTSGANTNTFTVSVALDANAQAIRVNPTTGVLEFTADDTANPIVWTSITFGLAVGATALTTAESVAIASGTSSVTTPVSLYNSLTTTPTVATLDILNGTSAGVDGILDGVKVDFIEDVGTVNSTGFSIFDRVTPATTASVTVAANALDASIVDVTAPQATLYGSGCATGFLETSQTCGTNANTASTSATPIPYDFSLTSATMTYARVYDSSTGALKTLPNIAAAGTISDGAAPVVVKVGRNTGLTNDPEGTLVMYFSEGLAANPAIGFVKTQNGSLALDILNNVDDGGVATNPGVRSQTSFTVGGITYNVANNTATFSDVDNDVLTGLTAVGVTGGNSGGSGFQDAAANFSGEHTISPDAAAAITTVAPTFDKAVAVVNTSGNITNILVFFTEPLVAIGSNLNQRFSLSFNGATVTPSASSISSNVVNLTLPGTGVSLRQVEGTTNQVTYDGQTTSGVEDSDGNDVADFGPSTVDIPANSDNLFSMEIRGTVTTNGSTAVAQGTLVRADLMRFNTTSVIDRGTATVPCNCTGSTKDVALVFTGGTSAFDSALYEAGIRGVTSIPVWVSVVHDGAANEQGTGISASVALTNPGAGSGQTTVYAATMTVSTGAITSAGSTVSGTVVFRTGPLSYTAVESARYGIVNGTDGTFRMNVGSNSSPLSAGDMFVIISVRQNGTTTSSWVPVTFADKSFTGYLPFAQDVKTTVAAGVSDSPFIDFQTNTGTNGVLTAAFRLDRILSVDLADSTGYQLVGTKGDLARTSSALADFRAYRFFTTVNTDTGAPYALWKFNQATDDEAFTLVGNAVKSSFSVNEHNVDNIGNSFVTHFGIAYKDSGNSVTVLNRDTLFYPVTASTATSGSLAAGWHLITVQAAVASPGNLGNSGSDNTAVGMIIEAGARRNGDAAAAVRTGVRTWIRGTTNNSLTALEAGKAYFVYLNAADTAWTGQ